MFVDTPTPQFVDLILGDTTSAVIPIVSGTEGEPDEFPQAPDGTYLFSAAADYVDLLVTAVGGLPEGISRKGIYILGLDITALQEPFNQPYVGDNNIEFDSLYDATNDQSGVSLIYLQANDGSFTWIGTNVKRNFIPNLPADDSNPLNIADASLFPDGRYSICAQLQGYLGGPIVDLSPCLPFQIDRSTPVIQAYKNSIDSDLLIVNGSSTNADAIAFVVNDATPSSGLDRAVLTDLGAVWSDTVTFGGGSSGTATIELTGLADNPFQLQAYDLAGNVASLGFFLDRTPPDVAISTPGNGSSYGPGTPAFNQVPINGVASDPESGIAYVLLTYLGPYDYWNGSTWYNDYTQLTVAASNAGVWTLDNSGTGSGPEPGTWDYTVTAQAVDGAGNYSSTATVTFSYTNTLAPIALYATWGQYINPTNAQDQGIEPLPGTLNVATALCPDGSTATLTGVTINGGAVSSQGPFLVPWNFAYPYAFDHQGDYSFTPDAQGVCDGMLTSFNFGIGTLSFVYDDQKPMVAISSPDFTQTVTQISGTASDNIGLFGVFAGAVDQTAGKYWTGTSWASGSTLQYLQAVGSASWSLPFTGTALDPTHTYLFGAYAVDLAGNQSPYAYVQANSSQQSYAYASADLGPVGQPTFSAGTDPPFPVTPVGTGTEQQGFDAAAAGLGLSRVGPIYRLGTVRGPFSGNIWLTWNVAADTNPAAAFYEYNDFENSLTLVSPQNIQPGLVATATTTTLGDSYAVLTQFFSTSSVENVGGAPELTVQTPYATVAISSVDAGDSQTLFAAATTQSLVPVSNFYTISGDTWPMSPAGLATFQYQQAALFALGLSASDLSLYLYPSTGTGFSPVAGTVGVAASQVYAATGSITGPLSQLVSTAALLGLDHPYTTLLGADQPYLDYDGLIGFSSSTYAAWISTDARAALAGIFVSTGAAAPFSQVYSSDSYSLQVGTYTLTYLAVSSAGVSEPANSSFVDVLASWPYSINENPAGEGWAIAVDTSGNVWEIVSDTSDDNFSLAENDPNGNYIAAAALPGGSDAGFWSLGFDTAGYVYAAGSALDPVTGDDDVAAYQVNSSCVLVSSAVYGIEGTDMIVLGARMNAGALWITGGYVPGDGGTQVSLGLWNYAPATGLLSQTTSYSGAGGLDAGTDIQVDASSNVWVIGYSSAPSDQYPAWPLSLALWEYNPSGTRLEAGPFVQPGYFSSLNEDFDAKSLLLSSSIYVAATRTDLFGGLALASLSFSTSGALLSEQDFGGNGAIQFSPHGAALDDAGRILTAGDAQPGAGGSAFFFDRFNSAGIPIQYAQGTAAGIAKGIAVSTAGAVWLAVQSSSAPFLFAPPPELELVSPGPISNVSSGSLSAAWSSTFPPGTWYEAELSTAPDFSGTTLTSATCNAAVGFSGLEGGATYWFAVGASTGGPVSYQGPISTETLPAMPVDVAGTALGVSSIAWTWSAQSADGFYVYDGYGNLLGTAGADSFVETGLAAGNSYTVIVAGYNATGTGPISSPASASTLGPPGIPVVISPYFSGGPGGSPGGPILRMSLGQPFVGTVAPGTTSQMELGSGEALSAGP